MATSSPSPTPAPAKAKRYVALTPIDLDNKRYEIGKKLPEMSAETAAPLLACGAIELAGKDAEVS